MRWRREDAADDTSCSSHTQQAHSAVRSRGKVNIIVKHPRPLQFNLAARVFFISFSLNKSPQPNRMRATFKFLVDFKNSNMQGMKIDIYT